jgi:hypothetical protein
MVNYSRNPAMDIALVAYGSYDWSGSRNTEPASREAELNTVSRLPMRFKPEDEIEYAVTFVTKLDYYPESAEELAMTDVTCLVVLQYEDFEGNLYHLSQMYRLYTYTDEEFGEKKVNCEFQWQIEEEKLELIEFGERKLVRFNRLREGSSSTSDDWRILGLNVVAKTGKITTVYHRKSALAGRWLDGRKARRKRERQKLTAAVLDSASQAQMITGQQQDSYEETRREWSHRTPLLFRGRLPPI